MTRTPAHRNDIATVLLGATTQPPWSNLGCWPADAAPGNRSDGSDADNSGDSEYDRACRRLALRHAEAVSLHADDRLLDLGCGPGASLRLWQEAFGVRHMTALERRPACVTALRELSLPGLERVHQADFDRLPLPGDLPAAGADVAICVDAAYHARSLRDFTAFAAAAVRPGGRLAFTTLAATPAWHAAAAGQRLLTRQLLALAGIPAASLTDHQGIEEVLRATGWAPAGMREQDDVLAGFADFAGRRGALLPWRQRLRPGWRKIALTAGLCRRLQREGLVSYVLVTARRR